MRTIQRAAIAAALTVIGNTLPVTAGDAWGPRAGVADDPDQLLLGLQMNVGAIAPQLYVQPDASLGLGSGNTVLSLSLPLHYHFKTSTAIGPYAGGGLEAGLVDRPSNDVDFELGLKLVGGLQWNLSQGRRFFTELGVGLGDLHTLSVIGGWMLW